MPKFSQVFLADRSVCEKICAALDGERFDNLVEIGPGGGALTSILFPKYAVKMTAVEIDRDLVPELARKYSGLKIINNDFMRVGTEELPQGNTAFIGNLPYDCSTAILDKVLGFPGLSCAVFMFQKEVALRIMSKPGMPDYGVLAISSYFRSDPQLICVVKAGSFRPVPAVDSAVIRFHPKKAPENLDFIMSLAKKAFMHRRKTMINSLSLCGIDKDAVLSAFSKLNLPEKTRAQDLPPETFQKLAEILFVSSKSEEM